MYIKKKKLSGAETKGHGCGVFKSYEQGADIVFKTDESMVEVSFRVVW